MPTIHRALEDARSRIGPRLQAHELPAALERGALVVDTRPVAQRHRDGDLAGAVVVERNVLEWRLDPTGANRLPQITDHDQEIVVVCNEGYASSLAAAALRDLGLRNATDLDGGYQAWITWRRRQDRRARAEAGRPRADRPQPPRHSEAHAAVS